MAVKTLILSLAICGIFLVATGEVGVAAPRESRFKDAALDFKEGDRLIVSGLIRAQVRLVPIATGGTPVLKARKVLRDGASGLAQSQFEALTVAIRRDGQRLMIEGRGPSAVSEWAEWLKPGVPELILDIEAPAVATEILLRDGSVTAQNWKSPLLVNMVDGSIKTSVTEGHMNLQLQKGEIRVDSHRGPMELQSFGGKVFVQNLEGDLNLVNFGGDSSLKQIKGAIELYAYSGSTAVVKATGALEFDLGRGSLQIQELDGAVRGDTDLGAVSVSILDEADVQVDSNQGAVTVQLPAGSGASIRLQSDEGSLFVPDSIRPAVGGSTKIASGRLPGAGAKGRVVVKSKTGLIRLR